MEKSDFIDTVSLNLLLLLVFIPDNSGYFPFSLLAKSLVKAVTYSLKKVMNIYHFEEDMGT